MEESIISTTTLTTPILQSVVSNQRIRSDIIKEQIHSMDIIQPHRVIAIGGEGIIFECSCNTSYDTDHHHPHDRDHHNNESRLSDLLQAYNLNRFVVKIIYNLGDNTFSLPRNEYEILSDLQSRIQYHPNIIPLLHHFIDIPSNLFFNNYYTDLLRELGTHPNGNRRSCTALIYPLYPYSLHSFLRKFTRPKSQHSSLSSSSSSPHINYNNGGQSGGGERRYLELVDRLVICLQLANSLKFLTQNYIIHRDLKLDNILIHLPPSHSHTHSHTTNTNNNQINNQIGVNNNRGGNNNGGGDDGRNEEMISSAVVVVADFGMAIKVNESYEVTLTAGLHGLGGNPNHLAPEIKFTNINNNNSNNSNNLQPQIISYKKQPSWEFGLLAYEIIFGEYPSGFNVSSTSSSISSDQFFSIAHFQEMFYENFGMTDDYRGGDVTANHIAQLLQPLLRTNAFERQHIWDAYRSFLSFIQTHYPNHPVSTSYAL